MGIQSRFVYLRHFGLRTKINFCINTVFVFLHGGKNPAHQKSKHSFLKLKLVVCRVVKIHQVFFLVCLFFTLAISRNFSFSFSTAAPPGGSREPQLVSFNYCNGIKFVQEVINGLGQGKTHCLFAQQLSRQITTEYTSLSSAHSNFPDFFLPFGSATWWPLIEHL